MFVAGPDEVSGVEAWRCIARGQYAAADWVAAAVVSASRMFPLVVDLDVQVVAVPSCLGSAWTGVPVAHRCSILCFFALVGDPGTSDFALGVCSGIVLPGGRLVRMRSTVYLLDVVVVRSCWAVHVVLHFPCCFEASPRRCGACRRHHRCDRTLRQLSHRFGVRCCSTTICA